MKELIAGLCCLMLAASPFALAQDKAKDDGKKAAETKSEPSEAQKKQQERMKSCNAKAGENKLEGEARKKFMGSCLKGDDGLSAKQEAQQNRMKECNKQASEKQFKGDERKAFMSMCLKG